MTKTEKYFESMDLKTAINFFNSPYPYKRRKAIEKYNSFIFPTNEKELNEWILANKKVFIENKFDKLVIARDIYRKGWITTDSKNIYKAVIRELKQQGITVSSVVCDNYIFSFKDERTATGFLFNFRKLIETVFAEKII